MKDTHVVQLHKVNDVLPMVDAWILIPTPKEHDARYRPLGANDTDDTLLERPSNDPPTNVSFSVPHNRTVPSLDPVPIYFPQAENATDMTESL